MTTALTEFDIIQHYFNHDHTSAYLNIGIGDDCAVLTPTEGKKTLISTDMLVEGRHFQTHTLPEWIAYKALAVNLSDLAACGATPRVFFLSLGLPARLANDEWLAPFSQTLHSLAQKYGCVLAGGDTTRADTLTISITVVGETSEPITRNGAKLNDIVWVSGTLGDAALSLRLMQGNLQHSEKLSFNDQQFAHLKQRLHTPSPRVKLGVALRNLAHSCIDVSDGLAGDIRHILKASDVDAIIDVDSLPLSPELRLAQDAGIDTLSLALSGGDDYELLFTTASTDRQAVLDIARQVGITVTPIGRIIGCESALPTVHYCNDAGQTIQYAHVGYQHF